MIIYLYLLSLIFLTACSISHPGSSEEFISFEARNGFEIFFDSGATKPLKDYSITGSIVINGPYFGVTSSGSYYPA
jgi:hypothetical protein